MSDDRLPPSRAELAAIVWVLMAIAFVLGVTRLEEVAPFPLLFGLVVVLFGLGPVGLLVWAVMLRRRKHKNALLVGAGVLITVACLAAGSGWLLRTSAKLNFEAHRDEYEAIVDDARRGRLKGKPNASGMVAGESRGVRFIYDPRRPDRVEFPWTVNEVFAEGVTYDQRPCKAGDGRCQGEEPLERGFRHYKVTE